MYLPLGSHPNGSRAESSKAAPDLSTSWPGPVRARHISQTRKYPGVVAGGHYCLMVGDSSPGALASVGFM